MGPDRFDDVEFRMLEQPEPPGRPRLRRWTLTALSALLALGLFAGGASALSSEESPPAVKKGGQTVYPKDYRDCERGKLHRRNSELRY